MTDTETPNGETAPQAEPQTETPDQLMADPTFRDDLLNGIPGSPKQREAQRRWDAAFEGKTYEPETPEAKTAAERAVDAMEKPPVDPSEYRFNWDTSEGTDAEQLAEMDALARESAAAIGAPVQAAADLVDVLERGITQGGGVADENGAEALEKALHQKYGDQTDAVLKQAQAVVAKMPEAGRQWLLNAIDHSPTANAVWAVRRLADLYRD